MSKRCASPKGTSGLVSKHPTEELQGKDLANCNVDNDSNGMGGGSPIKQGRCRKNEQPTVCCCKINRTAHAVPFPCAILRRPPPHREGQPCPAMIDLTTRDGPEGSGGRSAAGSPARMRLS